MRTTVTLLMPEVLKNLRQFFQVGAGYRRASDSQSPLPSAPENPGESRHRQRDTIGGDEEIGALEVWGPGRYQMKLHRPLGEPAGRFFPGLRVFSAVSVVNPLRVNRGSPLRDGRPYRGLGRPCRQARFLRRCFSTAASSNSSASRSITRIASCGHSPRQAPARHRGCLRRALLCRRQWL